MVQVPEHFKSGFVGIVGRPNVGKSTLMNAILGVRLSIVTSRPQTTRNRIHGVHTVPSQGQIIFVDTPGIHKARSPLNRAMVGAAWETLGAVDVVCFVVTASSIVAQDREPLWGDDLDILNRLGDIPTLLVINKVDRLPRRDLLLPAIERISKAHSFAGIIPLSALKNDNTDALVEAILKVLPEGPMLFPEDALTTRAERFFVEEMIREQVLLQTRDEVPYSVAVSVDEFVDAPTGVLHISAVIHVERESQKGILIGKGGSRLKEIGSRVRERLEEFFDKRVDLRTLVRVEPEWAGNARGLQRFGYGEDEI